ncbi:MAG: fibronectin type III domain-containing protein [Mogibacterium sp.]|nr:fibronectin type III domain-containing protein [Mogibacterium sp.]
MMRILKKYMAMLLSAAVMLAFLPVIAAADDGAELPDSEAAAEEAVEEAAEAPEAEITELEAPETEAPEPEAPEAVTDEEPAPAEPEAGSTIIDKDLAIGLLNGGGAGEGEQINHHFTVPETGYYQVFVNVGEGSIIASVRDCGADAEIIPGTSLSEDASETFPKVKLNAGTEYCVRVEGAEGGFTSVYFLCVRKEAHSNYTFGTKSGAEVDRTVGSYEFTPPVSDCVVLIDNRQGKDGVTWEIRDSAGNRVECADGYEWFRLGCGPDSSNRTAVRFTGLSAGGKYTLSVGYDTEGYNETGGEYSFIILPTSLSTWSAKAKSQTFLYTGSPRTSGAVVKYKGTDLTEFENVIYTVSYSGNTAVTNKAAVKITGKGPFTGSLTRYFTIIPKYTQIRSLARPAKRAVTVTWAKPEALHLKQTSGYQVQYALNKNFTSGAKTISIGYNTTLSRKITGLKSGKYYYFRVRTYKRVNGTYVYSGWSAVKYVKVK